MRKGTAIPDRIRKRELRLLGMFQPRERRHCLNRKLGGMMMRDAMTIDKKTQQRNKSRANDQMVKTQAGRKKNRCAGTGSDKKQGTKLQVNWGSVGS